MLNLLKKNFDCKNSHAEGQLLFSIVISIIAGVHAFISIFDILTWRENHITNLCNKKSLFDFYLHTLNYEEPGICQINFPGRWSDIYPPKVIVETVIARRFVHPYFLVQFTPRY